VQIDLSHAGQRPALCDGRFRHIVTIDDALRLGCNLFDLAELLDEYPDDEFANLFRCEFIDDSNSQFTLQMMQACMVDRGRHGPTTSNHWRSARLRGSRSGWAMTPRLPAIRPPWW
jgi:hypothetical protein